MFANQSALTDADLDGYAQVIGLDLVSSMPTDPVRKSPTRWRRTKPWAFSLGVDATPTFFIAGSWIVGDQPFSEFQKAIETAP